MFRDLQGPALVLAVSDVMCKHVFQQFVLKPVAFLRDHDVSEDVKGYFSCRGHLSNYRNGDVSRVYMIANVVRGVRNSTVLTSVVELVVKLVIFSYWR